MQPFTQIAPSNVRYLRAYVEDPETGKREWRELQANHVQSAGEFLIIANHTQREGDPIIGPGGQFVKPMLLESRIVLVACFMSGALCPLVESIEPPIESPFELLK